MRERQADPYPRRLDQADGLRRIFAGRRRHVLPLAANPHVPASGRVLDRLAVVLAEQGHHVLVVDAATTSPPPHELAEVDLSACVEVLTPRVSYLPARGLPRLYVDTRGSASGFIDAVQEAAPQAQVILLHADGIDLTRMLKDRTARPLLIGADHPESIKHAYANAKLLVRRCALMSFDLLLLASPRSPRAGSIGASLGGCLETFLGATLISSVLIDPAASADAWSQDALERLLAEQLAIEENAAAAPPVPGPLARQVSRPISRTEFR